MRSFPLLLLLSACGGGSTAAPAPAPATTPDPAAEEVISPPFGAADLRAAMTPGTEIRYRIVEAGKPAVIQHWVVTAADADTCTIHTKVYAEDGTTLITDEGAGTTAWTELEKHGRFPAAVTTRTDSSIEVPAGRFDTWLFVVSPPDQPTRSMHFARNLPGPPVWMQIKSGDDLLMSMELVSRTPGR